MKELDHITKSIKSSTHAWALSLGSIVCYLKSLHISLNTAHLGCKPSTFMSSFTHSLQVFLFLPLHLPPPHFYISTPNRPHSYYTPDVSDHLNLSCLTTIATLWTPSRLYKIFVVSWKNIFIRIFSSSCFMKIFIFLLPFSWKYLTNHILPKFD